MPAYDGHNKLLQLGRLNGGKIGQLPEPPHNLVCLGPAY